MTALSRARFGVRGRPRARASRIEAASANRSEDEEREAAPSR